MQLHWDGNNPSLAERNLSAALGAGVTPETVDHAAIERVAAWLGELQPPRSPHPVDPAAVERGRALYMSACAACHGYQGADRYVFAGANLGKVEPNSKLGTDPGRLDSYTEAFRQRQLAELFAGTPYQFKHFVKTDGYANLPLDGLWLRGPYLHNGAVPTLRDLLAPPAQRPVAFVRGIDVDRWQERRLRVSRPASPAGRSRRASATTPGCPAMATAATSTARRCRRPTRMTSSPICSRFDHGPRTKDRTP